MRTALPCWSLLLALGACATPRVQTAAPPACVQEGVASWYAPHAGQIWMADGRRLNPAALTAAHRSLPFGTMVRVTDVESGRSVVVQITDRGPMVRGRIIDVSPAAANALAMRRAGTARVRLEIEGAAGAVCPLRQTAKS